MMNGHKYLAKRIKCDWNLWIMEIINFDCQTLTMPSCFKLDLNTFPSIDC